jgi:ABC-type Zn uptake system ZnuABC Zn-binding protein ZnuA
MKKIINTIIVMLPLSALFLTGCGSASHGNDNAVRVLASTSFLADIAKNVAGDRLTVDSLLPIGSDPHAYQAAPSDVAKISESKLLIINGVEYEHFIEPLLENAGGERVIVTATDSLTPDQMQDEENAGQMVGDPHMWLDPNLVIAYVENIRDGFIKIDPDGAETYIANADAYIAQLKELDAWIVEQVSTIPAERRLLVTNHEAVGYFAKRYGFEVVGAVISNLSTDAGTSAKEMSALIEQIRASGAPAIFLGEVENTDLANQIADETGVKVINDLYLESLTKGAPAATYIDMMKHNVTSIVDGLK